MIDPWVQTVSGVPFDLLAPRAADVRIEDVCEQLSKIARYSGATMGPRAYSVAQHSVLVQAILKGWYASPELQREGLLHDAAEAYYGDITSPVQRAMRVLHDEMVGRVLEAVLSRVTDIDLAASLVVAIREACADPALVSLKKRVDPVVRAALGLPVAESTLVRRADLVALAIERRDVMADCARDWLLPERADTADLTRLVLVLPARESADAMRILLHELDAEIDTGIPS